MRVLFINSKRVYFHETARSTRPLGIENESEMLGDASFTDIALALVCVEINDSSEDIDIVVAEVERYSALVGRKIVMVPFAHLSSELAVPSVAKDTLNMVKHQLGKVNVLAGNVGFGSHKTIDISRLVSESHPGDFAFRDSSFYGKIKNLGKLK